MASQGDDFDADIALEGPGRREAIKRLHRLAKLEAQVEEGARELHQLVARVYGAINEEISGHGNDATTLAVTDVALLHAPSRLLWDVTFRGRPVLSFQCVHGYQAKPGPVIARCEVNEHGGKRLLTIYLARENGGVHWEIEPDQDLPVPLGQGDILIRLIDAFAKKALAQYDRS